MTRKFPLNKAYRPCPSLFISKMAKRLANSPNRKRCSKIYLKFAKLFNQLECALLLLFDVFFFFFKFYINRIIWLRRDIYTDD